MRGSFSRHAGLRPPLAHRSMANVSSAGSTSTCITASPPRSNRQSANLISNEYQPARA